MCYVQIIIICLVVTWERLCCPVNVYRQLHATTFIPRHSYSNCLASRALAFHIRPKLAIYQFVFHAFFFFCDQTVLA